MPSSKIRISLFFKKFLSLFLSDKSSQGDINTNFFGLKVNESSTHNPAASPPPADSPIQIESLPCSKSSKKETTSLESSCALGNTASGESRYSKI